MELGIKLLTGILLKDGLYLSGNAYTRNTIEIYTDAPERRRECLYFLAIGNFKTSNYSEARRFNDQLLKLEPRNDQALALKQLIDEKVSTGNSLFSVQISDCINLLDMYLEGVIGLAIVSGVVAVGAALVAAVVKRSK